MSIIEQYIADLFTSEVIESAIHYYGIHNDDLKFIRDFENYVYEFQKDDMSFIMRFTHSSHRTQELILDEVKWIKYLHDNNAKVSRVVHSVNNNLVETIKAGSSYFYVSVFEKAPGKSVDRNNPLEWNNDLFETWGRVVGSFHRLSKAYPKDMEMIKRYHWQEDDLVCNAEKYLKPVSEIAVDKQKQLVKWLQSLPQDADSYGLVHTDVHDGNFFVDHGQMTVFDFDDCRYDWYINDVAIVLFYVLFGFRDLSGQQRTEIAENFMKYFWNGYHSESSISASWKEYIPIFLKFREILVFTVLCKKWDLKNLTERQLQLFNQMKYNIENDIPFL